MALTVDIEKSLGGFHLKMRFETAKGVLALLGASGCGKSVTLKCIAGLIRPDRGRITLDGRVLFDSEKRVNLPPRERRVGYLFQQYALFPNMTVRRNIECGVRSKKDRREKAGAMIRRMGLEGLEELRPQQLSGGQQQRVALARILANEPDMLLLDEPFSALDSHLRFRMERQVREIIRQFGKPVVLVSHSRDEVYRLSDEIAVMGSGFVEARGDVHAVFRNPVTRGGAALTGCKNISPAVQIRPGTVRAAAWGIDLTVPGWAPGAAYAGIRMHDIRPAEESDTVNVFDCRVEEIVENPFSVTVMLRAASGPEAEPIGWETDKATWEARRADHVRVCLPPESILILKE